MGKTRFRISGEAKVISTAHPTATPVVAPAVIPGNPARLSSSQTICSWKLSNSPATKPHGSDGIPGIVSRMFPLAHDAGPGWFKTAIGKVERRERTGETAQNPRFPHGLVEARGEVLQLLLSGFFPFVGKGEDLRLDEIAHERPKLAVRGVVVGAVVVLIPGCSSKNVSLGVLKSVLPSACLVRRRGKGHRRFHSRRSPKGCFWPW